MMGFDTDEASVYQIRLRHRHQGVRELIPSDYGGVMHTDRALTYDAWALELVAQQKCCYHIIRSIDKVLEERRRGERLCSAQDHRRDRTQTRKVSGQRAHGLVPF